MTIPAGTKLGRYEIRSKIGAGGMGEVYLAEDTKLDRKLALKILPSELAGNQDRMRRFVQEAKAAAALNHPNIAHIYEIGESDGTHFIAMELVDGATLRERIHGAETELSKLLQWMQQVAEGLARAHAAGVVHRDLKPDNIMITRDGYAKILDFGLAKLIEPRPATASSNEDVTAILEQHSVPGMILGTVGYMSPEQAQGKTSSIDHRSDIFSFGCMLFEVATGRKAFEGKDTVDSLNKIIREPAALVSELNPEAPPDLQRIVRRCLAKDPDERYQTIRDVATELRELQSSESVTSSQSPSIARTDAPDRLGKYTSESLPATGSTKRRKVLIAMLAMVLVGVPALTFIGAYFLRRDASGPAAIESIAVLPFDNQDRDPEADYLADGMTESIINNITKLPNLRVIARNSAFRFKGKTSDPITAGNQLGVHAVLTGRSQLRGDDLIVSVELVDVRNNKQLWGDQYRRKLSDALAVQQEISREISERLRLRLTSEDQQQIARRAPNNPEAFQFYLRGRYYWNRRTAENQKKAIEQFLQAIDKDPNYALAYAGLADCYILLSGDAPGYPKFEADEKARAYAERAIEANDSLAEAHTSLAVVSANLWHWDIVEREYQRAIELDPNYPTARHWYSLQLRDTGRFDEALAQAQRAHELDPHSSVITCNLAYVHLVRGDVSTCIEMSRKVIEVDPNFRGGHVFLGLAYLKQQKYAEGVAALEKAVELSGRATVEVQRLGYGYAVSGQRVKALGIIKELEERFVRQEARAYDIAAVYAGLGDKDQAFSWVEKAFQARSGGLAGIRWHPPFESLRKDARYHNLLRGMGLPP